MTVMRMLFAPIQKGHLLASAMEIRITTATEKHAPFTVSFPFILFYFFFYSIRFSLASHLSPRKILELCITSSKKACKFKIFNSHFSRPILLLSSMPYQNS